LAKRHERREEAQKSLEHAEAAGTCVYVTLVHSTVLLTYTLGFQIWLVSTRNFWGIDQGSDTQVCTQKNPVGFLGAGGTHL